MKADLSPRLKTFVYGLMCVLLIPFVFPTWWMVTSSVKPISDIFAFPPRLIPESYDWTTYSKVFELQPFVTQYWNSAYIAGVVTVGTMVVSSMAGYAFARIRFPFANAIFMIVLLGLLIPSEVTIVPLFQMFLKAGMVNTHWPLILVPIFGAPSVFATFVMRQFFVTLPAELEEAARVDGLGRFKIFRKIALPLARPALASVAIFTFLHSWNLFLEPIVFLSSADKFTLPQALTQYTDAYGGPMWNIQLAAATLTALPVLIVFIIAQKQFVEGLAHTGLKG
ncbi:MULTISPECIES: carbohydrate ABC transporter permease [unclassified Rhizobium]|uniref:carbohydrate ABC transporter permease n=1 Tax=unclassified Rhizobium TaxID=2613769 RepID=UPI001A98DDCD|nr:MULTISPECIES: carbohydrate ABC transporter permease [unclassified Rhizobium]MBX5159218.1 carbohydrate ABC transporter permease [Rhizobium sp. NZLR8]MBX5162209.1 carbohydrate ABC transporter permease [Rhizobium sp. NZLR4b]MBX5170918.1 carbohydrate ABC transporter permease [Rhizobium sp. NZLR1b]MBX5181362.1 carbohydrate ABC transporter permease [Rhizobium sp. NZLR5]MBX5188268.1 carbohydrate ABC transporter permease [Rhizobium sp. NZLR3b]